MSHPHVNEALPLYESINAAKLDGTITIGNLACNMKAISFAAISSLVLASLAGARPVLDKRASILGIDVSGYQPNINWNTVKANGVKFVYIKATEGTSASSPPPMLARTAWAHCCTVVSIRVRQRTLTRTSRVTTPAQRTQASSAAATTLRTRTPRRAPPRPSSSSPTASVSC